MSFPIISYRELNRLLESGQAPVLIDLREADSYEKARILGSINIPYGELAERMDEIPRDRMVIFICDRGAKSMLVCRSLARQGYRCGDLGGGIRNYRGKFIDRTSPRL